MADAATTRITQPLKRGTVGIESGFSGVAPDAVARAEAALKALSGQFAGWLEEEVLKLEGALAGKREAQDDPAAAQELKLGAHDLKGLGGTYGFPLVTRVCSGLCRLLEDDATTAPPALLEDHVLAVRALVRGDVRDPGDPGGQAICEALERRTSAYLETTPAPGR